MPEEPGPRHNNGPPPLEDSPRPYWGESLPRTRSRGGIGNYFEWKAAHDDAWTSPPVGPAD